MSILSDHVQTYLEHIRPKRSQVMEEMESVAHRDSVPIVSWETGRLLATLVGALDPELVLEVGTAIGYSTLHMAEALGRGRIITLERDPDRIEQASRFLERAEVAKKVEIVEGDALESIESLDGPFDLLFLDASKDEYAKYLELAEPKLSDRAVLVVDNLLMSGEVALAPGDPTNWRSESLEAARAFNAQLLGSTSWTGSVLPVGDGVGVAYRS